MIIVFVLLLNASLAFFFFTVLTAPANPSAIPGSVSFSSLSSGGGGATVPSTASAAKRMLRAARAASKKANPTL
ncbi:unnamed protein product [Protopolystoma xenopodis]|uniref:Secreted protein n=1 Tax=Protopolystoma xenopodis TaxID=117903 RepID=A0A3S5CPB9_9PLAT|nr:unnamed protein product [Protopolystoma xenopodis]